MEGAQDMKLIIYGLIYHLSKIEMFDLFAYRNLKSNKRKQTQYLKYKIFQAIKKILKIGPCGYKLPPPP